MFLFVQKILQQYVFGKQRSRQQRQIPLIKMIDGVQHCILQQVTIYYQCTKEISNKHLEIIFYYSSDNKGDIQIKILNVPGGFLLLHNFIEICTILLNSIYSVFIKNHSSFASCEIQRKKYFQIRKSPQFVLCLNVS